MMRIKVERFLLKQGNRVGKAAVEFTEGVLQGFHLVGFTICDDPAKGGLYVLFPSTTAGGKREGDKERQFFFLRPDNPIRLDDLQQLILDEYEDPKRNFNSPRIIKPVEEVKAE